MTKVKAGSFSALNVSSENSKQILELSTPSCSMTPLLIDYGLDVSNPYDINAVSSVSKLSERLRRMRPSIVLYNLLGVDKKNMKQVLHDISKELTSYYSELLLDTLFEDLTPAEIKDLDVWYGKHEMQEQVYTVSYKITTDDKFLQNMMRSVDALPARTEANLESVNGRSAEFFKTSVLYARRKLIARLSFETSVIYRGTYGRKIPLGAMDDSCMILWWVKNKRPYQLFVTSSRDFMDVQRRMPASKISMVTFWSGRTSDVAQGGITMRDSATAGLGDQPPAPPRTLEQIPLQELYRPVPEEVLPPVTPPPVPADQPIEVDDEDLHPPDQPQQSMQPPPTPPHGGLHVPLPDSPMQDSIPGSLGPPQDPPPPSPPPASVPVQAPGSPLIGLLHQKHLHGCHRFQ